MGEYVSLFLVREEGVRKRALLPALGLNNLLPTGFESDLSVREKINSYAKLEIEIRDQLYGIDTVKIHPNYSTELSFEKACHSALQELQK